MLLGLQTYQATSGQPPSGCWNQSEPECEPVWEPSLMAAGQSEHNMNNDNNTNKFVYAVS